MVHDNAEIMMKGINDAKHVLVLLLSLQKSIYP